MRILTVEECDALSENLPQHRTNVEIYGLRVRIVPSDHTSERNKSPLILDINLPNASVLITSPLYPHRYAIFLFYPYAFVHANLRNSLIDLNAVFTLVFLIFRVCLILIGF